MNPVSNSQHSIELYCLACLPGNKMTTDSESRWGRERERRVMLCKLLDMMTSYISMGIDHSWCWTSEPEIKLFEHKICALNFQVDISCGHQYDGDTRLLRGETVMTLMAVPGSQLTLSWPPQKKKEIHFPSGDFTKCHQHPIDHLWAGSVLAAILQILSNTGHWIENGIVGHALISAAQSSLDVVADAAMEKIWTQRNCLF